MKSRTKTAIALAAVAILGGCASGGGGGEWHETRRPLTPEEIARQNDPCNSLGALLGLMAGGSCGGSSKSAYEPSSDSSSAYNGSASPTGSNSSASSSSGTSGSVPPPSPYIRMDMYYQSYLGTVTYRNMLSEEWTARMGAPLPGATVAIPEGDPKGLNPFVANYVGSTGVGESASDNGWQYQNFGVWNRHSTSQAEIMVWSYGNPTPLSGIPTSGSATFSGKLAGLYISPAGEGAIARAALNVNANFSDRSLSFTSTGTTLTRDSRALTAAPHLDLSGTATYSAQSNQFYGGLRNTGGTLSGSTQGQFYGPNAQELGGAFILTSGQGVETFAGAYGAKR